MRTLPSSLKSRFPQVLEDDHHLPSGQSARGTLVAHTLKGWDQAVGRGDILVKQAQGRGARGTGKVELGALAFGEGGGRPTPISCFATLLRRDKSLVVATDAHLASALYGGELADIVGIHNCLEFSV